MLLIIIFEFIRRDENGEVPIIVYYSSLINQTYTEIYEVLGVSDDSSFFDMENVDVEKYICDDYVFEIMHDDEFITEMRIRKKMNLISDYV